MLIIGFLALLQIAWLPGAILRRAFAIDEPELIGRAAVTFGLSLVANTALVALLVALGWYTRPVLGACIAAEAGVLALFARRDRRDGAMSIDLSRWRALLQVRTFTGATGLILALATVIVLLGLFPPNWESVFSGPDDVASWDRWAKEWAHGVFPTGASWYPQLLPANWSITYVLLGRTDVKMFAKATTTVFPLLTVGLFVGLALRRLRPAYLLGAFLCGWLLLHDLGPAFLQLGYADVPLAFFGFLTFYVVYREDGPVSRDAVLLSLGLAAGTVLTKQGGVYVFLAAIAFAIWTWRRVPGSSPFAGRFPAPAVAAAAVGFAAVCYACKSWQIWMGEDQSNLQVLTQLLHHGRTYPERLVAAARLLWFVRGPEAAPLQGALALVFAGSLLLRETRWITLVLICPFLLAWGLWFSYEVRNASLAFPFVALTGGIVLDRVISWAAAPLDRLRLGDTTAGVMLAATLWLSAALWVIAGNAAVPALLPQWAGLLLRSPWMLDQFRMFALPIAVVSAACVALQFLSIEKVRLRVWWPVPAVLAGVALIVAMRGPYADAAIVDRQFALQKQIGLPAVDARLYGLFAEGRPRAAVLTDYIPLRELPGLEALYRRWTFGASCSYEQLIAIAAGQPDVGFVMLSETRFDAPARAKLASSPAFPTVFVEGGIRMLAINRSELAKAPHTPGAPVK